MSILRTLVFTFSLLVLRATGSSTPLFLPAVPYDSGGFWANSVAVADLNGDGKADIVVANCGSSGSNGCPGGTSVEVGVLLGNGDGTFQSTVTYDSGGFGGFSITVGDLNSDGKPDLVVGNFCASSGCANGAEGVVGVLMGKGDGTFQPTVSYLTGGFNAFSVAIADLNGDSKPDLVVANGLAVSGGCSGGCIGVLQGNGNGTFQPAITYGAGPQPAHSVAVADVNGDGKPDLVVTNQCIASSQCPNSAGVEVLLGNGNGTFQAPVAYGSGGYDALSVAVADVNADGEPDILVANVCADPTCKGLVGVLLGNGNGTFGNAVAYDSGGYFANSVAVADVNGDGKPDLVVAHSCIKSSSSGCLPGAVGVLLGDGNGIFQSAVTYGSGASVAWGVAIGDVNGDGKPDLITANESAGAFEGAIGVLLNNTSCSTTSPVITLSTTPTFLWPPNGKMVRVTVSGTITGTGCTVTSAAYAVKDEYGAVQPGGSVTLSAGGTYSFTVSLRASRVGSDKDGRRYMVTVHASDDAGNTASNTTVVTVPHDRGH
jgi:hypothetical protein